MTGVCAIDGCAQAVRARGWCAAHYMRWRHHGDPLIVTARPYRKRPACRIEGCRRLHNAKGLCQMHRGRERRHGDPQILKRAPNGTGTLNSDGYVRVRVGSGFAQKHRLVVERRIGRALFPHEQVHHKNGDRADNRPENLELWSTSQPSGQRVEDKLAWARNLLAQYEPEPEWLGGGC